MDYKLVNVVGDWNCLVSAILLAQGEIDEKFYYDKKENLSFLTKEQTDKVKELRISASKNLTGVAKAQMETMGTWLGGEHINALAKAVGKTIVLIQSTTDLDKVSMISYDGENEKPEGEQRGRNIMDL